MQVNPAFPLQPPRKQLQNAFDDISPHRLVLASSPRTPSPGSGLFCHFTSSSRHHQRQTFNFFLFQSPTEVPPVRDPSRVTLSCHHCRLTEGSAGRPVMQRDSAHNPRVPLAPCCSSSVIGRQPSLVASSETARSGTPPR